MPTGETFLSDFIADHLRVDLAGRMAFADREVEIRPRVATTTGQRTDIRVQALRDDRSRTGRHLVVALTIEVKGCWNPGLDSDLRAQLAGRYMNTTGDATGLCVVGWYVCPSWKRPRVAGRIDRRKDALDQMTRRLRRQAEEISDRDRVVAVHVLDVALR